MARLKPCPFKAGTRWCWSGLEKQILGFAKDDRKKSNGKCRSFAALRMTRFLEKGPRVRRD